MTRTSPIVAWIVDDTGLPKKGTHSVGVARQYSTPRTESAAADAGTPGCGQTGKQDNCQVAVSLSAATWKASLPIAYRLYLPEGWANDAERRQRARIPQQVRFETKLEIALGQIRQAKADGITPATVLADPASGPAARIRPQRHNPHSIATLRIILARSLLRQLCQCPFCGVQRL